MKGGNLPAKIKREVMTAFWKMIPRTARLTVNEVTFKIPLQRDMDHKVMGVGRERWMDDVLRLIYTHRTGAFIDIGAHTGQTLIKSTSIVPDVDYIGFEPNSSCAGYINRIIHANGLQNCRIFPVGLGDRDDLLTLYGHNISDPKSTVVENFRGRESALRKQTVIIRHAGRFIEQLDINDIAVVKIDVEGYEASVLGGLKEVLHKQRPFVICEVLRTHDPSHPSHAFRVDSRRRGEALLQEADYAIWAIGERRELEPQGHISDQWSDYVFAPKESQHVLQNA